MFGHNQIRGQKAFEDADGRLLVTSMFMTLQGEGPFAGQPAFFVRLAYCNLNCSFCDTFFDAGDWYTPEELRHEIDLRIRAYFGAAFEFYLPEWARDGGLLKRRGMVLVLTGGEPMLQKSISKFLDTMTSHFEQTQIESNGILMQVIPKSTTLVISPKCHENSGKYIEPQWRAMDRADALKFVISADESSPYHKIPDWAFAWLERTHREIYVSPMNIYKRPPAVAQKMLDPSVTPEILLEQRSLNEVVSFWDEGLLDHQQNQMNHEYAARYVIQNGLRLNLQMQLYASVA